MDRWDELWAYVAGKSADSVDEWNAFRSGGLREGYPQGKYEAYMDVLTWMGKDDA